MRPKPPKAFHSQQSRSDSFQVSSISPSKLIQATKSDDSTVTQTPVTSTSRQYPKITPILDILDTSHSSSAHHSSFIKTSPVVAVTAPEGSRGIHSPQIPRESATTRTGDSFNEDEVTLVHEESKLTATPGKDKIIAGRDQSLNGCVVGETSYGESSKIDPQDANGVLAGVSSVNREEETIKEDVLTSSIPDTPTNSPPEPLSPVMFEMECAGISDAISCAVQSANEASEVSDEKLTSDKETKSPSENTSKLSLSATVPTSMAERDVQNSFVKEILEENELMDWDKTEEVDDEVVHSKACSQEEKITLSELSKIDEVQHIEEQKTGGLYVGDTVTAAAVGTAGTGPVRKSRRSNTRMGSSARTTRSTTRASKVCVHVCVCMYICVLV